MKSTKFLKIFHSSYLLVAMSVLCLASLAWAQNPQESTEIPADEAQVPTSPVMNEDVTASQPTEPAENLSPISETDSVEETGEAVSTEEPMVDMGDGGIVIEGLEVLGEEEKAKVVTEEGIVNFRGRVLEKGTKKPIPYAGVYLPELELETSTDTMGYFEFIAVPSGIHRINVPVTDYQPYETQETFVDNVLTEVTYYLEPILYRQDEIVVYGKKVKKDVSRKAISVSELKTIPGSQGDALKVVQNLPGVGTDISSGGLVMRGSNMEDSRVLIDGSDIPLLFHFGGFKSVYNSDLLEDVQVLNGGFGVEYGNATGGIVDVKTRRLRTDRWHGYVDSSLMDVSALVEGPTAEGQAFAGAFRRSTIDLVLPLVMPEDEDFSMTTMPVYYDYQFVYDWEINKNNRLRFDWYGALDKIEFVTKGVSDEEPEFTGTIGYDSMFHKLRVGWNLTTPSGYEHDLALSVNYQTMNFNLGDDFNFELGVVSNSIKYDGRQKLNKNNTLAFGVEFWPNWATIDSALIRPPKEGDVAVSFSNSETIESDLDAMWYWYGLYLKDEAQIGPVLLIPGIRFDYTPNLNTYSIDPRILARWKIIDPVTLKAAWGMYHRIPDADEIFEPYGNDGLEFERAMHSTMGVEWTITPKIDFDFQVYYKQLSNLVTSESDPESDRAYNNGGSGYVYGAEVFLRHRMTDRFYGWLSYSISRSMRNDGPGTKKRLFDQDETHNLVVLGSYKITKEWQIGGRFQLTSGRPYTKLKRSIYNGDNGTYIPLSDSDKRNTSRLPLAHQLDVRVDKFWYFNTWILSLYLDITSVYYHANAADVANNYDYTEEAYFRNIPIYPSLGIRAEF